MNLIKFPSPNLTNNSNKASNSLLYQDWEIDEVIENLSEDEQDLLIERISLLAQSWELTLDSELEAFLQTKYKESKTTFAYTDWLYDLAQEEVYRAYAIEQLESAKQSNSFAFIEPFNQIEKVLCDKLTNANDSNVDDFNINDKEATRNEAISTGETNNLINYLNQESVVSQDSDSLENCLQHTNSSQGHQNEINIPLIVSNNNYHTTKVLPNYSSKFPIKYINQQSSNFASTSYGWDNSLPLTKAKKALLIHLHQGKPASIHHPPSLPP